MSVWSVWGDEVWYSGWRAENYLSCITALVGPQDLEVKRLFNVQFFSCWSIGGFWTWRSLSLLSRSAFHIPNSLGILLPYRSSGSDWPWRLWMIPNPRFSPTLKGLGVCSYPSLTYTHPSTNFASPIILITHPSPITSPLLLPGPWLDH